MKLHSKGAQKIHQNKQAKDSSTTGKSHSNKTPTFTPLCLSKEI